MASDNTKSFDDTKKNGVVIWITGLSGAGKTTFASVLHENLLPIIEKPIFLDGDELRQIFKNSKGKHYGYERKDRLELAKMYAHLAAYLSSKGFTVIISTVSLFKEIFTLNRQINTNYIEVFIDRKLEEITAERSRKFYSDMGPNVVGVDIRPEFPMRPDITVKSFKDHKKGIDRLLIILKEMKIC